VGPRGAIRRRPDIACLPAPVEHSRCPSESGAAVPATMPTRHILNGIGIGFATAMSRMGGAGRSSGSGWVPGRSRMTERAACGRRRMASAE